MNLTIRSTGAEPPAGERRFAGSFVAAALAIAIGVRVAAGFEVPPLVLGGVSVVALGAALVWALGRSR